MWQCHKLIQGGRDCVLEVLVYPILGKFIFDEHKLTSFFTGNFGKKESFD